MSSAVHSSMGKALSKNHYLLGDGEELRIIIGMHLISLKAVRDVLLDSLSGADKSGGVSAVLVGRVDSEISYFLKWLERDN